jgi:NitT/TauT family transport system substrate-binding protein
MNRSLAAFLLLALGFTLFTHETFAQDKQVITFAYTDDVTYEPYVYAIRQGIVSSKTVEVKLLPTAIPALLQSTGTKQFDLVETSPLLLANAVSRGLDARIVGTAGIVRDGRYVLVQKDSPIKTPADLKGKTMGATAIGSTLVAHIRAVLTKQYGLNSSLENGDIRWVELPLPTLASALDRGQVDSVYIIHIPSLRAIQSGKFRILIDMVKDFHRDFGVDPLTSVVATYDSKIAEKGAALREAVSMLRASAAYAKSHQAEVLAAVAKEKDIDAKDLNTVSYKWYECRFTLTDDDQKMITTIFDIGKEQGLIPAYPPLDKFMWQ